MTEPTWLDRLLYVGRYASAPPEHRWWIEQVVAMPSRTRQSLILVAPNVAVVLCLGLLSLATVSRIFGALMIVLACAAVATSIAIPSVGARRLRGFARKHGVSLS